MNITISDIEKQLKNQPPKIDTTKEAAVLIPIIKDKNQQLHLLFQVRSSNLTWQPGDVCFPGGSVEPNDASPTQTAIRETVEELGILQDQIHIYGQLPDFWAVLGFKIYPIVGEITSLANIQLNPQEVEKIFTVPITWFIDHPPIYGDIEITQQPAKNFPLQLFSTQQQHWPQRSQRTLLFYQYQSYTIWGLTAQIIQTFLDTTKLAK